MTDCPLCDGSGWVKAAPIQIVAVWTGSAPEPEHVPEAAWRYAVAVPCPICYPANIAVLT